MSKRDGKKNPVVVGDVKVKIDGIDYVGDAIKYGFVDYRPSLPKRGVVTVSDLQSVEVYYNERFDYEQFRSAYGRLLADLGDDVLEVAAMPEDLRPRCTRVIEEVFEDED